MRIVYLLQDTGYVYGAEQASVDLACQIQQAPGFECHFLLIEETRLQNRSDAFRDLISHHNLPFTVLKTGKPFSLQLIRQIRESVQSLNADVLHTSGYKADIHGWLACRKICPMLSTVHGWLCRPDSKEQFYGWVNLLFLRRFDAVIALSRYYRIFLKQHGIQSERIHRIPPGVESAWASEKPVSPSDYTIGILGRLSWEKNHELFLSAAALVHHELPDAHFLIAGDGPEREHIQQLIAKNGLTDCVELAGYMPKEEFFKKIQLMVLCSRIENLPQSILEAMNCGIPVVATNVGGIPDLIENDVSGLLCAEEPQNLADSIQKVIQEPDKCLHFSENAQKKLREEFSVENWRELHLELYRSLSAPSGKQVGS